MEAEVLLAHAIGQRRSEILHRLGETTPVPQADELLARRASGEPLAYILGYREFYGREFNVRPGVLIPRQDSELLIEKMLALGLPQNARVLDFGTGSGCLAVTLKLERPGWTVHALDVGPDALAVARENASKLGAEVIFHQSDAFERIEGRFDAIISNPPYIADHEVLDREVADFEPAIALYSGATGLECYEVLAREAGRYASKIVLELGYLQGDSVPTLFADHGWQVEEVALDLAGIRRCLVASAPLGAV